MGQVYALISNAKEVEVELFYEDLQDLLKLTAKKDVLFIIEDWNAKVGSQETPGVTGKFDLGVQHKADQRLTEFCQENTLVIANTLLTTQERTVHMGITRWSTLKSDWLHSLHPKIKNLLTAKTRLRAYCDSDHELLIDKFRFKLKTIEKTSRSLRCDLNQIPYDCTLAMTNRFKGLDLINRRSEVWMEVRDLV